MFKAQPGGETNCHDVCLLSQLYSNKNFKNKICLQNCDEKKLCDYYGLWLRSDCRLGGGWNPNLTPTKCQKKKSQLLIGREIWGLNHNQTNECTPPPRPFFWLIKGYSCSEGLFLQSWIITSQGRDISGHPWISNLLTYEDLEPNIEGSSIPPGLFHNATILCLCWGLQIQECVPSNTESTLNSTNAAWVSSGSAFQRKF